MHLAGGDEQPDREEQRVARQDREEQPALDEDDGDADPEECVPNGRGGTGGPSSWGRGRVHGSARVCGAGESNRSRRFPWPARETMRSVQRRRGAGSLLVTPVGAEAAGPLPRPSPRPGRCARPGESTPPRVAGAEQHPDQGRRRAVGGPGPTGPLGPRAAARRGPAQRRRRVPLLAARRDRRRPRHPAARLPRRRRELGPRLQHRLGHPHGQRDGRQGLPHRRQAPVEPARRHGDRPLPARAPPPRCRGARPTWARAARGSPSSASTTCRARCRWRPTTCPARACSSSARRGPGCRRRCAPSATSVLHIEQFGSTRSINAGGRGGGRDARLGAPPRLRAGCRLGGVGSARHHGASTSLMRGMTMTEYVVLIVGDADRWWTTMDAEKR